MMKGFTLIETLVAIAILSMVFVAPFFAVEQSITAADVSRDELIGTSLAQEGVEYVRSVRDNDYLDAYAYPANQPSWLYGLDGTSWSLGLQNPSPNCFYSASPGSSYQCTIDPTNAATPVASYPSTTTLQPLYLSSANLYTQQTTTGSPTKFTRSLQLTQVSSTEVKVVVTVTWTTRNIPYVTTITEYLDNWLQ